MHAPVQMNKHGVHMLICVLAYLKSVTSMLTSEHAHAHANRRAQLGMLEGSMRKQGKESEGDVLPL